MAHNPPTAAAPPWRRPNLIIVLLLVVLLAAIAATTKVVDAASGAAADGGQRFNAKQYADQKYDTEVVPAIRQHAVPVSEVLAALATDPQAAGERYGHRDGVNARYAFPVSGTGVAGAVSGSLLPVQIDGLPAGVTVMLQIGPAISGTALRDATGLITFDQFLNQLEYADVSTELNNQVKAKVLAAVRPDGLAGQRVSFVGAFTYGSNPALIQVTPVKLDVTP